MITIEFDNDNYMYITNEENGESHEYQLDTPEDIISAFADYIHNYFC